jgi:hypothetical protein
VKEKETQHFKNKKTAKLASALIPTAAPAAAAPAPAPAAEAEKK